MSFFNFFKSKSNKDKEINSVNKPERPITHKDAQGYLIMPQPTVHHYREFKTTDYNGHQRTIFATEEEVMFPDGCLITSRTDLTGRITHANDAFVTMSGWQRHEIIGQTHNVLRHPDMPSAVFRDMWTTIQANQKWHGYMKNLRKDSSFYWVYATVIPNMRHDILMGYTSVRRKPSRAKIMEAEAQYRDMLAEELSQQPNKMLQIK